MSVAAQVAARKAAHPEKYCANPRCLWRITGSLCPRHPVAVAAEPVKADARPHCAWCEQPFTPNPQSFGVFCSRECGDAELGAGDEQFRTPSFRQAPALSFGAVRRRLAELNLEGANPATARQQASFRRADARANA